MMYNNQNQKVFPDIMMKTDCSHQEPEINLDSDRKERSANPQNIFEKQKTVNNDYLLSFFFHKNDAKEPSFENGRVTKYLFFRLMYVDVASMIISSMGLIISVLQYDLEYLEPTGWLNGYLAWVVFISTLVLIFFTTIRYHMKLELMKEQRIIDRKKGLIKSTLFFPYLMELCIVTPCPLPFIINKEFQIKDFKTEYILDWDANYVLSLYILLRILVIGRVVLNLTSYCNYRATRIGLMYGVDTGYMYSIRCMMKNSPAAFLCFLFFWIIVIFGHALRICERDFEKIPGDTLQFGYYYNSFWTIIVTMTTVGYGDYYPRTIPGRFVVFLVCIIGIFVVSSFVVALTNFLNLDPMESKVLNVIMRLQKRLEVKNEAAFVLTIMGKIHFLQKNPSILPQIKSKMKYHLQEKLKDHIKSFKSNNRQLRDMFEGFSLTENMNNSFGFVKMKFYDLFEKQKKITQLNERIAVALGLNIERT